MTSYDEAYSLASSAISMYSSLERFDKQELDSLKAENERLTKINEQLQRENSLHRAAVDKLNREMKRIDSGGW